MTVRSLVRPASLAAALALLPVAAAAQTCDFMAKEPAEAAIAHLGPGTTVQVWCAPCRWPRARKLVVEESELRQLDTYYWRAFVNDVGVDPAYMYVFDPRRRRWTNLGLVVACHEEDDVPPTLPGDKVVP